MEVYFTSLLSAHPVLAPALFVLLRAIPVIIPPIPGALLDLVGVAFFGWQLGLGLALMGGMIGAAVSFFIARYFRERAVRHFVPLGRLHELEARYSERQKFWTLVGLRIITSPFFDYANYAAGLTKMRLSTFLLATFLGVLPFAFIIYFVGDLALLRGPIFALMFFAGLAAVAAFAGSFVMKKLVRKKAGE